jgi:hypothetical protein
VNAPIALLKMMELQPKIEAALHSAGDVHTFEDILTLVAQDRLQVWIHGGSILMTEIADMPTHRVLHHFMAVGSLKEIIYLRERALVFARDHGCTVEMLTGRPGWERVARRLAPNWSDPQIQMSRSLV